MIPPFLAYIDPGSGFIIAGTGTWIIAFFAGGLGFISVFYKKILNFFKRRFRLIIAVAAVIATVVITGVLMNNDRSDLKGRIIILGFDGLSPEIIEPLMDSGKLPNFSSLRKNGSYSRLATTNPSQSPVAWAGFSTGKNPGKNGMFDFIKRDPADYSLSLSLSEMKNGRPVRVVKSTSFWQYASAKNVPSVILACPVTYPPDRIKGKMLSGMGVPDILGTEGTFTYYSSSPDVRDVKNVGGKVFYVPRTATMVMDLLGPRVKSSGGKTDNVRVPFKMSLRRGDETATVELQGKTVILKKGEWSPWQEVTFDLGMFRKAKGIFNFYLVETEPHLRLYIGPINFDPRTPLYPISYPSGYSRDLVRKIGLYHTQGMPMDTWAVNENRISEKPFLEQVENVLTERKAMMHSELAALDNGLFFCYFESPDIVQHMFWRYRDKESPLHEVSDEGYGDTIDRWYMRMDSVLGEVLSSLDEDDIIIVLSDHGFGPFRRSAHINSWLISKGYMTLREHGDKNGAELLMDVDWSRTKAYSIGFGAIYINLEGREKLGIVSPGEEVEKLKKEIRSKLLEWRDEKGDVAIVNRVYDRDEIFNGPFAIEAPDLYIGFRPGYRASWQTALGAAPETLIEDNLKKWSGSHLYDPELLPGVLFTGRKITKKDPSIYDIAPTVLKLIGYNKEERKNMDFDGTPLF